MAPQKPLEELYDLQSDPDELHNLSDDPAFEETLTRLRDEHFNWSRRTRDTGFIPEQMLRDFASETSEYAYAHSDEYQLERCIETVRLLELRADAVEPLRAALHDDFAPVRYWAATGLATLNQKSIAAANDLHDLQTDVRGTSTL